MAKSQRASTRKRNNAVLRSKLFGPAVDARTERLSAKLQELATKPKADQERTMEVDEQEAPKEEVSTSAEEVDEGRHTLAPGLSQHTNLREEMDVDAQHSKPKPHRKSATSNKPSRFSKHRILKPKKARNNVIFPDLQARKQKQKERRAQGKR